jgi:hypothetical protein
MTSSFLLTLIIEIFISQIKLNALAALQGKKEI